MPVERDEAPLEQTITSKTGHGTINPKAKVSNLVNKPKLNDKYEDAWFLKQNPQYWANLRAIDSLAKITQDDEDDPIMKLNPSLYKVVAEKKVDDQMADSFATILRQQGKWMDRSGFIRDAVNRAELDHPHSLHNATTGSGADPVRFPASSNDPANQRDHLQLNGYYDREAITLQNAFVPPEGPISVDTRMMTGAKLGSNLQDRNQIYSPNAELLAEIARNKHASANAKVYRPPVQQQVEEISPSGVKRELHPVVDDTQSSPVRNPFAGPDAAAEQMIGSEQDAQLGGSYGGSGTGPRNMFAVQLEASQEGPLGVSGDCRREMPDRPSAPLQDS